MLGQVALLRHGDLGCQGSQALPTMEASAHHTVHVQFGSLHGNIPLGPSFQAAQVSLGGL